MVLKLLLAGSHDRRTRIAGGVGNDIGRHFIIPTDLVFNPAGLPLLTSGYRCAGLAVLFLKTTPFAGHQAQGNNHNQLYTFHCTKYLSWTLPRRFGLHDQNIFFFRHKRIVDAGDKGVG